MARSLFDSRTPTIKPYLPAKARPTKPNGPKKPAPAKKPARPAARKAAPAKKPVKKAAAPAKPRKPAPRPAAKPATRAKAKPAARPKAARKAPPKPAARAKPKAKPAARRTKGNGSTSQRMGGANRAQAHDPSTFASESAARGAKCPCVADARYAARVKGGWAAICRRGPASNPTSLIAHGANGTVLAVGVPATRALLNSASN